MIDRQLVEAIVFAWCDEQSFCCPHNPRALVTRIAAALDEEHGTIAAEDALDDIAKACGCHHWEYPGQVVRDVWDVIKARDAALIRIERLEAAVREAYCMGWTDMAAQGAGFQEEPPVFLPTVQRRLAALMSETEEKACYCCRGHCQDGCRCAPHSGDDSLTDEADNTALGAYAEARRVSRALEE